MHTNTTGGSTDRPVLHRKRPNLGGPMTAWDQPTTEPSAERESLVQRMAEAIDGADWGPHEPGWVRLDRQAEAAADVAQSLTPAPQPAADTETEVRLASTPTTPNQEQP